MAALHDPVSPHCPHCSLGCTGECLSNGRMYVAIMNIKCTTLVQSCVLAIYTRVLSMNVRMHGWGLKQSAITCTNLVKGCACGWSSYTSCILAYTKSADCCRARKVCFFAELCAERCSWPCMKGDRRMADQENSRNKAWLVLLHANCM